MKKSAKIASGIVAVLIACLVLTWYSGKHIETHLTEMRMLLEKEIPKGLGEDALDKLESSIKITDSEFTRGFASSTYSYVVEFSSKGKSVKVKYTSRIKHGPFVGLCFGMGSSEDEWTLIDAPKKITDMVGGNKLMAVRSVYSLFGYTSTSVFAPDIDWKSLGPSDLDELAPDMDWNMDWKSLPPVHVVLKGIKFHGYTTYDLKKSSGTFSVKEFSLSDKEINVGADGVSAKFESDILANAKEPCSLFTCFDIGSQEVRADKVNVKNGEGQDLFATEKFTFNIEWSKKGDFLDLITRTGVQSLQAGVGRNEDAKATEFGPVHFDMSFRHLQSKHLVNMYDMYMEGYYAHMLTALLDSDDKVKKAEEDAAAKMALLAILGLEILKQSPEIRLDRVSFMTPQGEVKLNANVTIRDFKESDVVQKSALINKVEVGCEASAPTEWVKQFADLSGLETGKEEGYFSEKKGILSSKALFKNGELLINGKSFPVSAILFPDWSEESEESDESTEETE